MAISQSVTPLISPFPNGQGFAGYYHSSLTGDGSGGNATFLLNNPPDLHSSIALGIDKYMLYSSQNTDIYSFLYTGANLPQSGFAGLYSFTSYVYYGGLNSQGFYKEQMNRVDYLGLYGNPNVNTWANIEVANTNGKFYEIWVRVHFYKVQGG